MEIDGISNNTFKGVNSEKASKKWNELIKDKKVGMLFHSTC